MQYISEKERLQDLARIRIGFATQSMMEALGRGENPDMTELLAAQALLTHAQAQVHLCECFCCRQEFEGDDTTHYTIVIYQLYGPGGELINDIPAGARRLIMCVNCAGRKKLREYLDKR